MARKTSAPKTSLAAMATKLEERAATLAQGVTQRLASWPYDTALPLTFTTDEANT